MCTGCRHSKYTVVAVVRFVTIQKYIYNDHPVIESILSGHLSMSVQWLYRQATADAELNTSSDQRTCGLAYKNTNTGSV